MTNYFVPATLACYAASLGFYVRYLYAPKRAIGHAATFALAGGLILHYFALLVRSRAIHGIPYDDLTGSLSLFAWLLAATYLGLELVHRQKTVGAFVLPVVLALFACAHAFATPGTAAPPARGPLFAFHVTLNILAYAAFALSFVASLIYLIENRMLRDRRLGPVGWRFPPLEALERLSRSSVGVGLVSLGIGASLGFVWAHRLLGRWWNGDWKVFVTLLIFAAYATYLLLSRTGTWRGARASLVCVGNFVFVIFSYSIVNLYLSRFHRFF
ncbi:MAG: cytochrome c biogenesis protein CcsA [Candidatus Acidiferrales bacterium]|jgi:ABC-type transport system involved in cytochrome c biogenesis permease subunit